MSKPFVFTLMPFDKSFDDIYKIGIQQTCQELGTYCERVDEQVFQGSILDRVLNQISKADIIVADMSGRSPNVFFEVGYAKALNKKIVFLTSNVDDIPFDLKHYAHIVYSNSIIKLKEELSRQLKYYLDRSEQNAEDFKFGLNLFIDGTQLVENTPTNVSIIENRSYAFLTIVNISTEIYKPGDIKIGATGPKFIWVNMPSNFVLLPDKSAMYVIECETSLFPESSESYTLCNTPSIGTEEEIKIKVYTRNGSREFHIILSAIDG